MREYFLEMNSQGRIPCKARGYGTLKVDWFRKTGSRESDWKPIRAPNQVDSGTLFIPYVQKSDAGDYVCVAQSSYRNARINMTVRVIVGSKFMRFNLFHKRQHFAHFHRLLASVSSFIFSYILY